jgi:hypothetical protein
MMHSQQGSRRLWNLHYTTAYSMRDSRSEAGEIEVIKVKEVKEVRRAAVNACKLL